MKKYLLLIILLNVKRTSAQHEHHHMAAETNTETPAPMMSHAFSRNLPMSRNGSGTGWLPDSTPVYAYMIHGKKWMYMLHGNVFGRYTKTDLFNTGSRGSSKADVINWFMGMGQRNVGKKGLFRLNVMLSLDNLFGGQGYPLLFQTGESWQGQALVDRQHPHDLFSEVSVAYSYALNKNADVYIYAGYPGEPALGSVAFMHRVSSLYNPDAPLSHHWNDGTHITFGVLTAGVRLGKFKAEVSSFTGREPDENRYNFDRARMDAYSGRLSFNPNPYWSFQLSRGFVKSPEQLHPNENVNRTTASAVWSRPLGNRNFITCTALWGLNQSHDAENAILAEGVLIIRRWAYFTRYEFVQKSAEELALDADRSPYYGTYDIHALTLGLNYDFFQSRKLRMALGLQGSAYHPAASLQKLYGKLPFSGQVFLRIYPPRVM